MASPRPPDRPGEQWKQVLRAQLRQPPLPLDALAGDSPFAMRLGNIVATAMLHSPRAVRAHAEKCLRTALASAEAGDRLALLTMAELQRNMLARRNADVTLSDDANDDAPDKDT